MLLQSILQQWQTRFRCKAGQGYRQHDSHVLPVASPACRVAIFSAILVLRAAIRCSLLSNNSNDNDRIVYFICCACSKNKKGSLTWPKPQGPPPPWPKLTGGAVNRQDRAGCLMELPMIMPPLPSSKRHSGKKMFILVDLTARCGQTVQALEPVSVFLSLQFCQILE